MRMLAILMVLLGSAPAPASANDDLNLFFQNTPSGNDPRGAVMCIWMINVSIKALGENCHGARDAAYLEAIDWSIREMETFIIRNSDIAADQIAQGRAHFVRQILKEISADRESICASGPNSIYPAPDKIPTRQEIEAGMRQLLSIDRPPVWNPCL